MLPAPEILSNSIAAEMTELYWMALLRDLPLASFATDPTIQVAVNELETVFTDALNTDMTLDRLRLGLDLPQAGGILNLTQQTLFRNGFV
jgi:hypothetical protein